MKSKSSSRAGRPIDPGAIALTGTYVIELTAATGSDVAAHDAVQP